MVGSWVLTGGGALAGFETEVGTEAPVRADWVALFPLPKTGSITATMTRVVIVPTTKPRSERVLSFDFAAGCFLVAMEALLVRDLGCIPSSYVLVFAIWVGQLLRLY